MISAKFGFVVCNLQNFPLKKLSECDNAQLMKNSFEDLARIESSALSQFAPLIRYFFIVYYCLVISDQTLSSLSCMPSSIDSDAINNNQ